MRADHPLELPDADGRRGSSPRRWPPGCTVVLKPAEQTPLTALRLGELALEAGIPPGVVNVLTGDGETGAALVDHPGIDKIAFTGSTEVGREIGAKAGRALKRVTLELGGKSPNIILPDADLKAADRRLVPGDLLQHRPGLQRRQPAVRPPRPVRRGRRARSPSEPASRGSARASTPAPSSARSSPKEQHERVLALHRERAARRAPSSSPAAQPATATDGYFVEPTLFTATSDDLKIAREEIFGPVLVALPYESLEEVAARANDTEYGLAAGRVDARRRQRPPARRAAEGRLGVRQLLGRRSTPALRSAATRPRASAASTAARASRPTSRPRPSGPSLG